MRIVQICPGTGDHFYCENCLRDAALVRVLRRLGHDVLMVPLYLPPRSAETAPLCNAPLFFGGINVYLQQKLAFFRRTPRWVDQWLDSHRLLAWVGRKAGMTSARSLGETTISMLQGEYGRQVKELDRFVDWLVAEQQKPDIVCLSNILLAGMTSRLKQKLGVPVVCLLQDEDGFLDGLAAPHAEQAWEIVRQRARDIDAFLSVSRYFSDVMAPRLGVGPERLHVVYMGVDPEEYPPAAGPPAAPTIGFLSRLCPDRGLERLVDAFILLKKNAQWATARLRLCGGQTLADEPFLQRLRDRLTAAGLLAEVDFLPAFDRRSKQEFLRSLSVLSVPETRPIACGLYVLEALATGVPVVEPAAGCFPEILARTGGGVLYEPNTAEKLAETLAPLLLDPQAAHRLGAEGRAGICREFSIERAAGAMLRIYERVVRQAW